MFRLSFADWLAEALGMLPDWFVTLCKLTPFPATVNTVVEVYLGVVEMAMQLGRQSLMLVPEIALTAQMEGLFRQRFQSKVANTVRNRLSGETIRDTGCSLKAFRARHVKAIPLFSGMHRFLPTLCRLAGARRVVEIPVEHRPRRLGTTKYGMWNRVFRSLVDLFAVRWMQSRWIRYEIEERIE